MQAPPTPTEVNQVRIPPETVSSGTHLSRGTVTLSRKAALFDSQPVDHFDSCELHNLDFADSRCAHLWCSFDRLRLVFTTMPATSITLFGVSIRSDEVVRLVTCWKQSG
jgi:hypothetical protein